MKNLFDIIFDRANDNGKSYLNTWIKPEKITGIYLTAENWFYISILSNRNEYKKNAPVDMVNYFYAISQKNDCSSSTFGDERHFKNMVKKESIIETILN